MSVTELKEIDTVQLASQANTPLPISHHQRVQITLL